MNFFYRSLETVQEQAKQAAAQASALAQQASQQTAVLASSATGQAQQSFKSLSVPAALQKRFESLKLSGAQDLPAPSPAELQALAITPEFEATVRGLTYSTFRDFRLPDGSSPTSSPTSNPTSNPGSQQADSPSNPSSSTAATSPDASAKYLTPWQERHALLICRQV